MSYEMDTRTSAFIVFFKFVLSNVLSTFVVKCWEITIVIIYILDSPSSILPFHTSSCSSHSIQLALTGRREVISP